MVSTVYQDFTSPPVYAAWLNDVNNNIYDGNTAPAGTLRSTLATQGVLNYNPALAFNYVANTIGWTTATTAGGTNILRYIPPAEWPAVLNGTSTTDLTSYIQSAVSAEKLLYVPQGRFNVSATQGIKNDTGCRITGAGKRHTIFWGILGTGGTSAQLAAQTAGSIFGRTFNVTPPATNPKVSGVTYSDFSVILNHPTASITTTAIQIGIDFRNMSRTECERVHVGNYAPEGSFVVKADPPSGYAQQGYAFVYGTVSSALSTYCGGEVHTNRSCAAWGAYKLITSDDSLLSPNSAAHGLKLLDGDHQGGHHGLVQESQYSTGHSYQNNTIQGITKQNGDASTSYAYRFSGYDSKIGGGQYMEIGSGADFLLKLESSSFGNDVDLGYFSGSAGMAILDSGTDNALRYRASTATLPAVNSAGKIVDLYNKAYRKVYAKFFWTGTAITILESVGVASVTRNSLGNYTVTMSKPMPSANWVGNVNIDTGASFLAGMVEIRSGSQSTVNFRFDTYQQNAGTTTVIDPVMIYFSGTQS